MVILEHYRVTMTDNYTVCRIKLLFKNSVFRWDRRQHSLGGYYSAGEEKHMWCCHQCHGNVCSVLAFTLFIICIFFSNNLLREEQKNNSAKSLTLTLFSCMFRHLYKNMFNTTKIHFPAYQNFYSNH
jgi:hypothetical protein